MNIHQLSLRYSAEQDRLRLFINTTAGEELQVWLTRRLTLKLWPAFNQMVLDHFAVPQDARSDGFVDLAALDASSRQMLAEQRRKESLQNADFKTPYQSQAKSRPLGEQPLLATKINLTPRDGGQLTIDFGEQIDPEAVPRGFQMTLATDLVFGLLQLLGQTLEQAQWLGASAASKPVDHSDAANALLDAKRPTYLN